MFRTPIEEEPELLSERILQFLLLYVQWAHAIAPDANIVLVAANPAETEGVQGFPSIFKGEQMAINAYPGVATGGGLSVLFPTPDFQSGISQSLLNGARGMPDLSWNAAVNGGVLVYTSFPGLRVGWHIVGGTSAASPQLAGLIALTNQLADESNKAHVGYLNPLLYQLPTSDFNDIVPQTFNAVTLADNGIYGSGIPGMAVTQGYDLSTGFGSPKAYQLVHDLASILP